MKQRSSTNLPNPEKKVKVNLPRNVISTGLPDNVYSLLFLARRCLAIGMESIPFHNKSVISCLTYKDVDLFVKESKKKDEFWVEAPSVSLFTKAQLSTFNYILIPNGKYPDLYDMWDMFDCFDEDNFKWDDETDLCIFDNDKLDVYQLKANISSKNRHFSYLEVKTLNFKPIYWEITGVDQAHVLKKLSNAFPTYKFQHCLKPSKFVSYRCADLMKFLNCETCLKKPLVTLSCLCSK